VSTPDRLLIGVNKMPPAAAASPASADPGVPGPLVVAGTVGAVLVIGLVVAGLLVRRRLRNPEDEE